MKNWKKIIEWWQQNLGKGSAFFTYFTVWRELSSLAVGLLLWVHSAAFLHWIDPMAATYDAGVFQVYLFAVIGIFILHGIVRILMKLIWPTSEEYLDHHFKNDFKTITPWQKLKLSTAIFFGFLFAVALLARAL